jgi:oxygen-independent coproporphyrinogen-3 oxidase
MLRVREGGVRWANGDDLEGYLAGKGSPEVEVVGRERGFEEAMFLGLRMNEGVNLETLRGEFGERIVREAGGALSDVQEAGLVECDVDWVWLTARGRMASNEVFGRFLVAAV